MKFIIGLLALSTAFTALAKDNNKTWTDPVKAAAEDPDFSVQGEYRGTGWGLQVVALGNGAFDGYLLEGGLPGEGYTREKKKTKFTGKTEGDKTVLKAGDQTITLTGGTATLSSGGSFKRVERESPTIGAKPPAGADVLFDGTTAEHFKGGKLDGDLLCQGVTSLKTYQSHTIHLEFRTPYKPHARGQGRGNSGLYMQGRYETQILDSFGLEGKMNECGGVYSISESKVNMCYPPLRWQTYDVDFTAAKFDESGKKLAHSHMTVKLNGVIIHENLECDHSTTASPSKEGPKAGPVYIQQHGNPVRFRNIWVMPK